MRTAVRRGVSCAPGAGGAAAGVVCASSWATDTAVQTSRAPRARTNGADFIVWYWTKRADGLLT